MSEQTIEVGSPKRLQPNHVRELAASGIPVEFATEAGVYSEHDRKKLAKLARWKNWPQKYGSALVFPYHDLDGRYVYSRLKPERPPLRNGKPAKYLSPSGEKTRAYFAPGVAAKLAGNSVRWVFTEGEKKAICANHHGFPCIGLSGVWNFQPSGNVAKLLPELEQVEWHGREVYVAFDSDAVDNSQVRAAEQQIAATMQGYGATVRIVRIPAADDGGKQGIDDFIVAAGPGAFHKLLEEAEDPEPIDPGTLKADAKDADPADVARRFLSKLTVNCHIRLRWWLGGWWYWSNGCYSEVSDDDIKAKVTAFMADEYFKVKIDHVNNVLLHIRSQSLVDSLTKAPKWLGVESKFAADECFVTRNGVVHLPSMVRSKPCFEQSDPSLFNMVCGDFEFDSDAPRPERWHKFLDDLFGDDDQSKRLLQSWFGYCLLPQTNLQKFLLILGPKRSGKGTLARVLQAMLGERSVAAPTLSSLATNFGLQPLVGKTLAIISDARLSGRTDQGVVVERLLSITGEDLQTIDRKHRESVSTKLPTRFMVMTNELPRLADASGALVGRMLLLHTPRSFYGNEQVDLSDQLIEELPGIFRWAAVGWANLQQARRFVQPDSSLELLGQMQDLSSPVSEFLRECCVVGPEYSVPVDDLYERWRRWCEASGKARATDKATFGRDVMAAAGVVKRRVRSGDDRRYEYFGVDLQAELNGVCP